MACPHVAGVLAQLLQQNPLNLAMDSAADVKAVRDALICASSKDKITPGRVVPNAAADSCEYGTGIEFTPLDTLAVPTPSLDWQCAAPALPTPVDYGSGGADFTLPAFAVSGGQVKIEMVNLCNDRYTVATFDCIGNTFIYLYDPAGKLVAQNDNVSATNLPARYCLLTVTLVMLV
jgi:hypothetical protein